MNIEKTRPPHGGHGERGITVLLRRMHDAVAQDVSVQRRLDLLTQVIATHVVSDVCSIYLRRPNDVLELYSTQGLNREAVHKTKLNWGEGLVGMVAKSHTPLVTGEAPNHPSFAYRPETGEDMLQSFLGVPLIRSGKTLGVLVVQNKISREYSDDEVEAVQAVAALLAEVAASGELLSTEETAGVGEMLGQPERLRGFGIVAGIAFGRAVFLQPPTPKHKVFATEPAVEAERLESALNDLRASVDDMLARHTSLSGVSREVLEGFRLFAYDRGWKDRLRTAVFSGLTAESAVEQVMSENRARMNTSRDAYLRERLHDLDDLSYRMLRILSGEENALNGGDYDSLVLVAREMGPSQLLEYDRDKLKGLVLGNVCATSHVAIVARALNLPMITGVHDATEHCDHGDFLIVDGDAGELHVRPTSDVAANYEAKQELQSQRAESYAAERDLPCVTEDGVEIGVHMNAGLVLDIPHLEETGAAGIGLFRTELQFLVGSQLPSVASQETVYRDAMDLAAGKPVVFRTADIGADKTADYMTHEDETNPAMGWRGIRMALDRPGMIRPQLRALIAAGAGRDLNIMIPMVTLPSEIDEMRVLMEREIDRARRQENELPANIRLGAMIETPAAAWRAKKIAARVDFLSIGGNDLAQFFFAADRDSERVQQRYDPLNPGFLEFIRTTVDTVRAQNVDISYCGEQASDSVTAAALVGVGLRSLSMPAAAIGPFRRMIRSMNCGEVRDWLEGNFNAEIDSLRPSFTAYLRESGVIVE